jgi:hypothetical protein
MEVRFIPLPSETDLLPRLCLGPRGQASFWFPARTGIVLAAYLNAAEESKYEVGQRGEMGKLLEEVGSWSHRRPR